MPKAGLRPSEGVIFTWERGSLDCLDLLLNTLQSASVYAEMKRFLKAEASARTVESGGAATQKTAVGIPSPLCRNLTKFNQTASDTHSGLDARDDLCSDCRDGGAEPDVLV